jgi:hypothetical protein
LKLTESNADDTAETKRNLFALLDFHQKAMQFEDADEDNLAAPLAPNQAPVVDFSTPRAAPGPFVDDDLEENSEDEDEFEEDWPSEDEWEMRGGLRAGLNEVLDQDWADASGGMSSFLPFPHLEEVVLS